MFQLMTPEEREVIKKLELCDFSAMHQYYLEEAAKRKNRTKEEKEVRFVVYRLEFISYNCLHWVQMFSLCSTKVTRNLKINSFRTKLKQILLNKVEGESNYEI